jgi:hypothetical protein
MEALYVLLRVQPLSLVFCRVLITYSTTCAALLVQSQCLTMAVDCSDDRMLRQSVSIEATASDMHATVLGLFVLCAAAVLSLVLMRVP